MNDAQPTQTRYMARLLRGRQTRQQTTVEDIQKITSVSVDVPMPEGYHRTMTAKRILREAAEKHGVSVADVMNRDRSYMPVLARQEAAYNLWKQLNWSRPRIGKFLDRDHTTILHACRAHQKRIDAGLLDVVPRWVGEAFSRETNVRALRMQKTDAAVWAMLAKGAGEKVIAEALNLSTQTVRESIARFHKKLATMVEK